MPPFLQKSLPHVGVLVGFALFAFLYFSPALFNAKAFNQSDNSQARGMQAEILKYKETKGEYLLWTDQPFGGMPTYQIMGPTGGNVTPYLHLYITLGNGPLHPVWLYLLCMVSMYVSLLAMGLNWRLAALGGLASSLLTYNLLLVEAGHSTKVLAIIYSGPMIASALAVFRGRLVLGGALLALFTALQFNANHLQITYYTLLLMGLALLGEFIGMIIGGKVKQSLIASAIVAGSFAVGAGTALAALWTTYEYSQETIRGKSELKDKPVQMGLTKDYIDEYTPGIRESFALLVPNYVGGTSRNNFIQDNAGKPKETQTMEAFRKLNQKMLDALKPEQKSAFEKSAYQTYWGDKPMTTGPAYFGTVLILLFFVGMALMRGGLRWGMLAGGLFLIALSWGSNWKGFFDFMYANFPMYNRFRDVSTTTNVLQTGVLLLALLALAEFFNPEVEKARKLRALYIGGGITGGLLLVALFVGLIGNPTNGNDAQWGSFFPEMLDALRADRKALIRNDALRGLLLAGLSFGALWFYVQGRLKNLWVALLLGAIVLFDFLTINLRYAERPTPKEMASLSKKSMTEIPTPSPTAADKLIMQKADSLAQQGGQFFRVLDIARGSPLASAMACFFHKSLNGYHAAKLMRYQEVAERYIIDQNAGKLSFMDHPGVLDMFNVRYVLFEGQNKQLVPQERPTALGNAWFVDSVRVMPSADDELLAIASFDPKRTATVNAAYAAPLEGLVMQPDSTDRIEMTAYHPERLTFKSVCKNERLAVFSEIYYPPAKGWKTYIDGQPAPDFTKVDYVLRGVRVPAGEHSIEMRFEPKSYATGRLVGLTSSVLMLLGLGLAIFFLVRKGGTPVIPVGDYDPPAPKPIATPTVAARKPAAEAPAPQRRRKQ